ncbi:MAG: tetratricopeptide repeat protein [Fimbriimonadaceae bacterium]
MSIYATPEIGRWKVQQLRAAELALSSGDTALAAQYAESLIAEDPGHLPALEVLAKALWQLGDLPRLTALLDGMIRLNPYEPGYFALIGAAYQSLGRIGAAISAFGRSLELDGGKDSSIAEMLVELRRFQAYLIEGLLADDAVFRGAYRHDPVAACRTRGFEIDPPAIDVGVLTDSRKASFLAARPS